MKWRRWDATGSGARGWADGQARRGRAGWRLPIGGFAEARRIAAEIGTIRGGDRIAESQALEQGLEALASGEDGHRVPAAAAPGADKHIDGEHPFQEGRPGKAQRTGRGGESATAPGPFC
jgi:hypothetical protein